MSDPAFPRLCSSLPAIPSKSWTGLWTCFLSILVSVMAVSRPFSALMAAPSEPSFTAFHPRVGFGERWKTSVVLVNIGANATSVRLFAHDVDGNLLGEISGGPSLLPGERRVYPQGDDAFPEKMAALRVQSNNPFLSFLTLESLNGKGLEAILPTTAPNPVLTFPLIREGVLWWNQLSLLNTGPTETGLKFLAFDKDGNPLAEALLPALSPMASTTVTGDDLFEAPILASTATVQVMAGQPLAGLQLFGPDDSMDVAALPAPLGPGQQLFLPIFHDEKGTLWSQVGLINPRDGPVSIIVEAFDAQHRSLGHLSDLTSLPPHASHFFVTSNIGGALPANTAFLMITADQPISGYAVIGAMQAQGLTAIGALTENDHAVGYELIGSNDGHLLAAVPVMVMADGTVQSALVDLGEDFWKKGVARPQGRPEVSTPNVGGQLRSVQKSITDQRSIFELGTATSISVGGRVKATGDINVRSAPPQLADIGDQHGGVHGTL